MNEIDYIFSDNNLVFSEEEKFYSEKVVKFDTIWSAHIGFNLPRAMIPTPSIKNGYITFGSFNNFNKISDETIKVWASILKKIDNSKLLLKSSSNLNTENFKKKIKKIGLDQQIEFVPTIENFNDHLNYYNNIDLSLDTFPYNGVTTTFEAIWKGIPVLTMEGYNFNSRCGASIIKNLGIEYLVAKNQDDYTSKAIFLSKNLNELIKIRKIVFDKALESPLFDTEEYTKNFEKKLDYLIKKELENKI